LHELSIALALLEQVTAHAPAHGAVRRVRVRAGAMQAIEPDALQLAWEAATVHGPCHGAKLQLELLPWRLHCHDCGRGWTSHQPMDPCDCGSEQVTATGADDLLLMSLEVEPPEDPTQQGVSHAGAGHR